MRKHAILATLLVAFAPLSHAASRASASVTNFKFELTDLAPNDGVTSSYQWLSDSTSGLTALSANAVDKFSFDKSVKDKSQAFFQHELSVASDKASAAAKVGDFSTSASGAANGGQSSFDALASTGKTGPGVLGDLKLSAHSKLSITVDASVFAEATDPGGTDTDWARATSSLGLLVYGANGNSFTASLSAAASSGGFYDYAWNPSANKYQFKWVAGADSVDSKTGPLTVVFENTTGVDQFASLSFSSKVSGVGAIPEPDVVAQVLAGLCAVAWAFRRSRSTQS